MHEMSLAGSVPHIIEDEALRWLENEQRAMSPRINAVAACWHVAECQTGG